MKLTITVPVERDFKDFSADDNDRFDHERSASFLSLEALFPYEIISHFNENL